MSIKKSIGVTRTERLLADLCERTFLKLWSYPNPFKEDQDELCDLLAVFNNNLFIFFDRENLTLHKEDKDPIVNWNRWKKKVIDAQIRTAKGAERYIKSGRQIFIDKELQIPFPFEFDLKGITVHKIIIAHGAEDACKKFSDENVYGSLAISYGHNSTELPFPFSVHIDKEDPVHVFDSFNLPIIFDELDTFFDFSAFLEAKIEAIKLYDSLCYCGEEDLLAHYFVNFDESRQKHFIGIKQQNANTLMLGEGEWESFIERDEYKNKKMADKVSYFWDELIQRTAHYTLEGSLLGGSTPLLGKSAIHEMAKEPRFRRRTLSEHMVQSIRNFPETSEPFVRNLSFMPSFYEGKGYVFLQLKAAGDPSSKKVNREKRQAMLEIACGVAKNRYQHLEIVIGIAIDAPKYTEENSEDFILMDCTNWTTDVRENYEHANKDLNFFKTENIKVLKKDEKEFPSNHHTKGTSMAKIGRNEPCPCGSGKKYKKCCIDIEVI